MAGAAHTSDEIWHRSIEDLLRAIEPAAAAIAGPFVINLRTDASPIRLPSKDLPHFDRLHTYQLSRRLGKHPEFQLRLGIIETELEADAILATVRKQYPGATKESVDEADRAAIALAVRGASSTAAQVVPAPAKRVPTTAARAAVEPVKEPRWDIDELLPDLARLCAPRAGKTPSRTGSLLAAASGVKPTLGQPQSQRKAPPREYRQAPDATRQVASAPIVSAPTPAVANPVVAEPTAPAPPTRAAMPDSPPVAIDSTRTVRALTALELTDDEASQWFAIELSLSEEPIDAEQVPVVDIFEQYPLYSVTGLDQDRLMHALRVGFFSSKVAAEAVSGYLAAYFPAPTIKRVSIAERERFADSRFAARKDVGASGAHAAIELVGPPALPERRVDLTSIDSDARPSGPSGTPSLWSRLTALRARTSK